MSEWRPHFDRTAAPDSRSLVFAFNDGRMLAGDHVPQLAELPADLVQPDGLLHIGLFGEQHCFAVAVPETDGMATLRSLIGRLPEPLSAIAGRAAQIVEWDRAHAFCGRCGTPTARVDAELARACPSCGAVYYPRINPAVIMLVEREGQMLLGRRPGSEYFSTLAGFVDTGETLEEAVRREVHEEVGLEVDEVRYFASQPWPFPSQLMVGFSARSNAGEIHVDASELAEARWFGPGDELPAIPTRITIARWLIDDFLSRAS